MRNRTDIGMQAVRSIFESWQIDDDRVIWYEDGFDWWPGHFKQTIRVSNPIEHMGVDAFRIFALTEVISDASTNDLKLLQFIDSLSKFAPSYAYRVPPSELSDHFGKSEHDGTVSVVSTAYLYEENKGWLPRFFSELAILQPIDAQIKADFIAKAIGGRVNTSTPNHGESLLEFDEMLDIVARIYAPEGTSASRWAGSDEFELFAEKYGRSDICFGMGDPSGITLETPFGEDSAIIQIRTDQQHPQLGNGLLATLKLPWFPGEVEAVKAASSFNFHESISNTFFPLVGSWCAHATTDDAIGPAFSSFIPNSLYRPGIATNVTLWMLGRARWIKDTMWPNLEDLPMAKILERRFGPEHQQDSSEKTRR